MKTIGERIRTIRRKQRISQQELADAVGVHRVTINRIEHDRTASSTSTVMRIAEALGTEAEQLFIEGEAAS